MSEKLLETVLRLGWTAGLLVLPVPASAQSDAYAQTQAGAGFDGLTQSPWLMVPQYGNNSVDVISPASPTFPVSFFLQPDSAVDSVSPKTTVTSPQTITVHGETLGDAHQVAFGVGALVAQGSELHLSVKPLKTVAVALHAVILQKGDAYDPTPLAPTAQQAQAYLNQVYGAQTNTYFAVTRKDHALQYDVGGKGAAVDGKLDFRSNPPFTAEQTVLEDKAKE